MTKSFVGECAGEKTQVLLNKLNWDELNNELKTRKIQSEMLGLYGREIN